MPRPPIRCEQRAKRDCGEQQRERQNHQRIGRNHDTRLRADKIESNRLAVDVPNSGNTNGNKSPLLSKDHHYSPLIIQILESDIQKVLNGREMQSIEE